MPSHKIIAALLTNRSNFGNIFLFGPQSGVAFLVLAQTGGLATGQGEDRKGEAQVLLARFSSDDSPDWGNYFVGIPSLFCEVLV